MEKETKNKIVSSVLFFVASLVMLAVGLLLPSFYWLILGCVAVLLSVIHVWMIYDSCDSSEATGSIGCFWVVVVAIFSIVYLNNRETRYISDESIYQHIYENCPELKDSINVKKMMEIEAYFHLRFSDCSSCNERKLYEPIIERTRIMDSVSEKKDTIEIVEKKLKTIEKLKQAKELIEDIIEDFSDNSEEEEF